ncbi:hypothetical protein KFK09_006140 [Dendrobium nobile]|uniref:J domain-containing protein n=1 Tax=Dendrobium nobile TaxID=94219 RepID=A0A8T3BTN2_DENNO|nr:hypothetical protein KFK09_006140 [Dendrobium nobile]
MHVGFFLAEESFLEKNQVFVILPTAFASHLSKMDCNKEEATRAKEIAENKMHSRDFVGAKKLLLKALHLSPDIENASHMLTVCEVHCSAGSLVNGQTDHYGVLQVEVSADEALIKKQYRRLALLLHPDKNKFAGAEAAFKLVGEAYKVLSDQANRQVYDSRRRVQMRVATSWQPSQNSRNARRYTAPTINVSKNQFGGLKQQDQHPPSSFFASQCFWTMCVFCNNRFQYSRSWLNREVQCQKCFKKFFAFEVSPQNVPPPGSSSGFNWSHTSSYETAVPTQHSYNHGSQTNASQPSKPVSATKHEYGSGNKEERANQKSVNTKTESKPSSKPLSGNSRRMRNRKVEVNSTDSDSSAETESIDSISEVDPTVLDGGSTSGRYPRRSTRSKTNITYKEDESEDDDIVSHSKKLRKVGSFGIKNKDTSSPVVTNGVKMKTSETPIPEDGIKREQTDDDPYKDNLPGVSFQERGMMPESKETVCKKNEKQVRASSTTSAVGSRSRKPQAVSSFSYPDPEFFDFNKERHKSRFAKNQVWAVYDDDDGMPRFYALIQKPFGPGSRLQYIWLEYNPTSAAENAWVAAELPIACGSFTHGKLCNTKNQQMFSHLVFPEVSIKYIYSFYPKKGEVWALFKEWDIGWSSAVERPRNYVYEIVQVVSDFAYGTGITVCHLAKVKGFRYVFAPVHDEGNTVIPSGQLLKFSHRIPCYRIREEREGIPIDSFELDPAALPESFVKITDTVSADNVEVLDAKFVDPSTVEDKLAGTAVNNNGSRHRQSVFETGSKTARGQVSGNSGDILDKSNQTRERPVDSEARYDAENRRGEAIGHDKQGPANGGAESNDDDEDFSFNEEECTNEEERSKSSFYNFQDVRAEENFEPGQIWALYSDIDEYPKYYAWIKKVEWEEAGFVSIKWLEHAPETEEEKIWAKNGLPFGCGRFKIVSGIDQFDTTDAFSHMVHAKPIKKNDLYEIYPNNGEIWALYKNWSLLWTSENIGNAADYFLVEIIERNESVIKAVTLTKVKGYNYVFMPEKRGVADVEISIKERMRFSHLIPAFRLTIQESGKLEGYWELDPDSVPKILLTMDS